MRFKNSVRNSAVSLVGQIINILCGFGLRMIFINQLGKEYLGVNGVMESILTLLSVTELGIGTSIAFALYKPIDEDNKPKIGVLMAFYRRTYHAIGIITVVAGLILIPFMNFFTKDAANVDHINVIYLIFLGNTALSYFFSYKRTLINAYQNYYINSMNQDLFALIKYLLQIVVLLYFKSYIGFLMVNLVCILLSNVVISNYCDKKYDFIKKYRSEKLLSEDKTVIKTSIISLMYQRIGAALVTGTDNLMISFVSITTMGIYSNYTLVVSTITRVVYNVLKSIMGSVGSLMVQEDSDYKYRVYEELVFADFCLYFVIAAGFSGSLERFIEILAGPDWVLSPLVTFAVVLNFFLMGMRQPNVLIIEAAGIFNRLRLKAVIEVVVNLIVSILFLLVLDMGIHGVLFGTTVSMVSVCIWWESLAVHKYAFNKKLKRYAAKYIGYLAVAGITCFVVRYICDLIPVYGIVGFLIAGSVSVFVSSLVIILLFGRTKEFANLVNRIVKKY